jgi:hypothetical protein
MREQRGANSALSVDLPKGDLGNVSGTLWERVGNSGGTCSFGGRHMAPSQHSISCILATHKCTYNVVRRKALSRMSYKRIFVGFLKTIKQEKLWDTIKGSHPYGYIYKGSSFKTLVQIF